MNMMYYLLTTATIMNFNNLDLKKGGDVGGGKITCLHTYDVFEKKLGDGDGGGGLYSSSGGDLGGGISNGNISNGVDGGGKYITQKWEKVVRNNSGDADLGGGPSNIAKERGGSTDGGGGKASLGCHFFSGENNNLSNLRRAFKNSGVGGGH